jgi:hypothetical protein
MWWAKKPTRSVRIIAVPPPEKPLWVRQKWVGLTLPLTGSANTYYGVGVLTGPRTFLAQLWALVRGRSEKIYGFPMDAARAVEILDDVSSEAVAWWRENARELILPKRYLLFHAEVCEILG